MLIVIHLGKDFCYKVLSRHLDRRNLSLHGRGSG